MELTLLYKRGIAFIIDLIVLFLITMLSLSFVLALVFIFTGDRDYSKISQWSESPLFIGLSRALHLVYFLCYFSIFHWCFGATPGKYLLKIKLETKDLEIHRSFLRTLTYFLSGHLTLGMGCIIAFFRKDKKTLHDIICDTKVISSSYP